MTLPAPLLSAVEQHACFSGHYRSDSTIQACVDPAQPVELLYTISCGDCLTFQPAILKRLLPIGMTSLGLADAINAHLRSLRGYSWSISGYFSATPSFWISAAYFGDGLFLVDGSRNRNGSPDVDVLIAAFRLGVVKPADARMLDPGLYAAESGYVRMDAPNSRILRKQDLLASPHYSASPKLGFRSATVLEFLPLTSVVAAPPPALPEVAVAPLVKELKLGDVCPKCGAEVKERPLFSGTFVGCMC
jgi:hypothetical protein